MKTFFLSISMLITLNSYALNYGLFKLEVDPGYFDKEEVTFLLNSNGDVELLENENYYTVKVESFFNEITLEIESGGDEDYIRAIYTLKDNQIIQSCSALFDGPGESLSYFGEGSVNLLRWNKKTKAFEAPLSKPVAQKSCRAKLIEGYEDFSSY